MRQRIVINLDETKSQATQRSQKAASKRRRWPRFLALLAVFVLVMVVIAAVGGFVWWRSYQSTPAYTLTLLLDAAQRNDAVEFQTRINDDEIAKNMVASVSQKAASRYGYALNSSIQGQIDKSMPALLSRLKQTIHDEVVKEIKEFAAKSEPRPFIFLLITVPSLMTITTEGDIARVKAPLTGRTIELTMQRDATRWKVTEFKDDVVIQRVVDSVMKELPAIGTIDSNSPLFKKPQRKQSRNRGR
jgi:nitrate reductase NapE component